MAAKGFKYLTSTAFFSIFLAVSGFCSAEGLKTVEVWKNLFTVVNGDGVDSNTTFLITRDGVVVVDTRVTPNEAEKLLVEIRKQTNLAIVYTINTHYHGDHTFGNQVFQNSGAIIAHENVRRSLFGDSKTNAHILHISTKDEMEIFLGGYSLRLIHVRGHTDGDLFIYIKELKTLITGDLVVYKKIPDMSDAYIEDWISAMNKLGNLDAEIYIPGHGDPGGKPVLLAMRHYLFNLKTLVLKGLEEGKSLKETQDAASAVLIKKYKGWENLDLIDANIQRAYLEYSLRKDS